MNGAEALVATAVRHGIEVCFANPGTTEMPLVLALDAVPGLRGILCLHENVATGAADGYGRMARKPAMCLLHLGPGLANGLTNLHNARRAFTPILNVIGQHATWHLPADPLLATNITAIARTVSDHVKESRGPTMVAADLAAAIEAAEREGGCVSTLIVPHDSQTGEADGAIPLPHAQPQRTYSADQVLASAAALKPGSSALLLGGEALSEAGLMLAARIAAGTRADLLCDTFFARMERGAGLPAVMRLPYFADEALKLTRRYKRVIVAGTRRPVAFFGYEGVASYLIDDQQVVPLAGPREDAVSALAALASELGAQEWSAPTFGSRPALPTGPLNAQSADWSLRCCNCSVPVASCTRDPKKSRLSLRYHVSGTFAHEVLNIRYAIGDFGFGKIAGPDGAS